MSQNPYQENLMAMWVKWHWQTMLVFWLGIWKNYLAFNLQFFSMPFLLSTLFSPWRKYTWNYPRSFSISAYANIIVSNIASRIIGALCRVVLIILGLAVQVFMVVIGGIALLVWMCLPILIFAALFFSLLLFF